MDQEQGPLPDDQISQLKAEIKKLNETLSVVTSAYTDRAKLISSVESELQKTKDEVASLHDKIRSLQTELKAAEGENSRYANEVARLINSIEKGDPNSDEYRKKYEAVLRSTSWRITSPLRSIALSLRRWKR